MGLAEFSAHLEGRLDVVDGVIDHLETLLEKYEAYYGEIRLVREHELGQLTAHVVRERGALPGDLDARLDAAERQVVAELDDKLAALAAEHAARLAEAEAVRARSAAEEAVVRARNVAFDGEEEALKARNAKLLGEIAEYNGRIRQLSRGFGFFANLFKVRALHARYAELQQEQADVAAHIGQLRDRWAAEEADYEADEASRRAEWVALTTKAATLKAKLDHLSDSRDQLVRRSALERVLFADRSAPERAAGQRACPRCQTANPEVNHFCFICAQRLSEDRPDLAGSLLEMRELNHHFERFSAGMKATQELVGLVRGLRSGLRAFNESVEDMIGTERKYPLPKLVIDVPEPSRRYGEHFDALGAALQTDRSLHPEGFAARARRLVEEVFTEAEIKAYFERMGQELSARADAQW